MLSYLYVVIVLLAVHLVRPEPLTCTRDEDCDEEYACSNKRCTKCLKCDVLLRIGNNCITDFNQCGECLEGYEEVSLTDSSLAIKPCKPVRLKEKLGREKCVVDNSCPPDNYCLNQICIRCFNCSLVNRVSNYRCAKELSDCGSCMNGYDEVAVTTGSDLKACESQSWSNVLKTRNYSMSDILYLIIYLTLVTLLVTTSCLLSKKRAPLHKSKCLKLPSAPPLHEMHLPQDIIQVVEEKPHRVHCRTLTVERNQQAKVYQQPNALYYYQEDRVNTNNYDSECMPNNTMNFSGPTGSEQSENQVVVSGRTFVSNYVEPGTEVVDFPHPSASAINEVGANNINGNDSQLLPGLLPQVINSNNSQPTDVPVEETVLHSVALNLS